MTPLISIVVPSYNRRESLRRLIESLGEQTFPPTDFEVIVVDDGSTDGTAEWLRSLRTPYPLQALEQANGGPARARNAGVARAQGELILFLDDDVKPVPALIQEHVAVHEVAPDAVVIGPMLPPPPEWHRPPWVRWHEGTLLEQYRAMENAEWACSWRQFYSANVSMRRATFLEVGGFDTTFRRSEDTDLADRLARRGIRFLYAPKAGIEHYAEHGFHKWRDSAYQYGRYEVVMARDKGLLTLDLNTADFYKRHPLTRWATITCVGRVAARHGALGLFEAAMRTAEQLGLDRPALLAASAIFSLMYWQGVSDELGGRVEFLLFLAAHRPALAPLQPSNPSDQSVRSAG